MLVFSNTCTHNIGACMSSDLILAVMADAMCDIFVCQQLCAQANRCAYHRFDIYRGGYRTRPKMISQTL